MVLGGLGLVATVYGDGSLRPQFGHDLLVTRDEMKPAREVLLELGFRLSPGSGDTYLRDPSVVRITADPCGGEGAPPGSVAPRPDLDAVWERAEVATVAGQEVWVPGAVDRLSFLAAGLVKRSFDRLVRLVDLAECWRAGGYRLEDLERQAFREGTTELLYYALRAARERLGAPVPESFLGRLRPPPRRLVDRSLRLYLEGRPARHFPEWLLLHQVEGFGPRVRALRDLLASRDEIASLRAAGGLRGAAAIPLRLAGLAARGAGMAAMLFLRSPRRAG
jgi:hypothetical protein